VLSISATFQLLDFAGPRLPTLGWFESALYAETVEGRQRVAEIALDREESLRLIEQTARHLQ